MFFVYFLVEVSNEIEIYIFLFIVDNEFGVFVWVIGLFFGCGYNIDSLMVLEIEYEKYLLRIIIVIIGILMIIE